MVETLRYGTWPSPVGAQLLVAGGAQLSDVQAADGLTWWSEGRPEEAGRQQILRRDADGTVHEVLPPGWSARTRVHEYGGGAWWVHGGAVFFSNWSDQRLYRLDPASPDPSARPAPTPPTPVPLTPVPPSPQALRYADHRVTPDGAFVVTVRQAHEGARVRNEIVAVPGAGMPGDDGGGPVAEPSVLVTGPDFVAAPRLSPDGRRLAWLAWDHPDMPWDATTLWVADLSDDGRGGLAASAPTRWAGGPGESLVQPEWGADGRLYVVSDRSDWWNVHRLDAVDVLVPVHPVRAEVGQPAWVFGQSRYAVAADGTVWIAIEEGASARVVQVPPDGAGPVEHSLDGVRVDRLRLAETGAPRLVALLARAVGEPVIVELALPGLAVQVLRPARELGLDPRAVSRGRRVSYPSAGGRTAHAWFYPPAGLDVTGPPDELPPLVTMVHGGPTSAADPQFSLSVQFWTTRGFAVVDVDHGGSTGYGRGYRRLLDGGWGRVDVEDVTAAARWLAGQRLVDGERMVIRGGSAGGFTVLAALATTDVFAAGASRYGVADLAALARDTHKFESRYLDRLVGPWPQAAAVYAERSPLTHLAGFDAPLIVFQGLQDEVVPPAQSELIVRALAERGVPHAYLTFPDEQHGFRTAATIVRTMTAELYFFCRVFGLTPAGDVPPVDIEHAAQLIHR